jgi:hypothetical protein
MLPRKQADETDPAQPQQLASCDEVDTRNLVETPSAAGLLCRSCRMSSHRSRHALHAFVPEPPCTMRRLLPRRGCSAPKPPAAARARKHVE